MSKKFNCPVCGNDLIVNKDNDCETGNGVTETESKMNRKIFFDEYRSLLDKDNSLTDLEVKAIDVFLDLFEKNIDKFTVTQWAYVFATTFHETAFTFLPLKEAYKLSEEWRKKNLRYYPYYGRGYVQLTWKENYAKYGAKLNLPLVDKPDIAMQQDVAFSVIVDGMKNGVFTGKKISDYINNTKKDYLNARRVINGMDKAQDIKNYAVTFEKILNDSLI